MTTLSVSDLHVAYGGIGAVHGVSLTVEPGRIATVIGPNGAGKTTLLNAIMGVHPGRGTVRFQGRDIGRLDIEARVRAGMCLVPEKRELFAPLSVEDNLRLGAFRFRGRGRAADRAALDEIFALFPRLEERRRQQAGTLSGGERQMLAMGRALMAKPDLLMLDEPSLGLAPLIVQDIFRIVSGLRGLGTAILLVEQNARAALQVSDYGYVLETGTVVLEGPSATLAEDERVVCHLSRHGGLGGLPTRRVDDRATGSSSHVTRRSPGQDRVDPVQDDRAHRVPRLRGRTSQVRQQHDVLQAEIGGVHPWLAIVDVQPGRSDLA